MSTLPFLLEIGTEEIPDWMITPALNQLRELFQQLLQQNSLNAAAVSAEGTPRRLVLRADGLPPRQPDTDELLTGPPVSAAYKDGKPTGAALGFAKKMGIAAEDLQSVKTPKGEYLAHSRRIAGREVPRILSDSLQDLILKIHFPKTMYWTGKGGPRFIRPIRWIVALLGEQVVPFELAGVPSGSVSSGHRRLGSANVSVDIAGYRDRMRENFVLVSGADRKAKIESELKGLLDGRLRVKVDDALLDTWVNITEYPTPILGSFDEQYLTLPSEVLVTVMRHHQKYFSVEDAEGNLAPHFVAVMNTSADPEGLVRKGNERVLRARFNDARFFWDFDQHKKLADRVDDLANVTYQAKLGSYLDKTRRVADLAGELAEISGMDPAAARRAAMLSKCDLTTEMVKEFTELQGVVGGLYARAQGETEEVALAIYEHYKPVSMEDSIPATPAGRLLALADKLDTLRGCFAIGMVPTGSKDPFALRRAAQGVVKILVEGRLSLPLSRLLNEDKQLEEFFVDRLKYYFREIRGFQYDEVNAVLASGYEDLPDVESRLQAIQAVRPTENFEPLAASFKRIQNILRQAQFTGGAAVDAGLLEPGPEADLFGAFQEVRGRVEVLRRDRHYRAALEAIASLRPPVDLFFDKVLVNAPDARVRENRLALLHSLLTEFSAVAGFSEIVTQQ